MADINAQLLIEDAGTPRPMRVNDLADAKSDVGDNYVTPVTQNPTVVAPALATRICATLWNDGPSDIYVGYNTDVTTATGTPVPSGSFYEERDFKGDLIARTDTGGSASVRTAEVG